MNLILLFPFLSFLSINFLLSIAHGLRSSHQRLGLEGRIWVGVGDLRSISVNSGLKGFRAGVSVPRRTGGAVVAVTIGCVDPDGRMNALTERRMQKIFTALVLETVKNDARRFLEYDSSEFYLSLKII